MDLNYVSECKSACLFIFGCSAWDSTDISAGIIMYLVHRPTQSYVSWCGFSYPREVTLSYLSPSHSSLTRELLLESESDFVIPLLKPFSALHGLKLRLLAWVHGRQDPHLPKDKDSPSLSLATDSPLSNFSLRSHLPNCNYLNGPIFCLWGHLTLWNALLFLLYQALLLFLEVSNKAKFPLRRLPDFPLSTELGPSPIHSYFLPMSVHFTLITITVSSESRNYCISRSMGWENYEGTYLLVSQKKRSCCSFKCSTENHH